MTRSSASALSLPPTTAAPPVSGEGPDDGVALTIGEVARRFGVTLRALRFYEDRGLLSPEREGTARFYAPDQVERLQLILKGKRLGFTLTEIRELLARHEAGAPNGHAVEAGLSLRPEQVREQIALLERQQVEIAEALDELRARLKAHP